MAKSVQSHLTKALENIPAESAQCREVLKDEVPNIAAAVDQMKCDNTMEQLFETDSAPIQQGSGPHSAPGPSDGQAPAVTTIAAPIPANQKRGYSKEELASGTPTDDDLEAAGYVRVLSRPGDKGIVGLNCGLIMSGPLAGLDLTKRQAKIAKKAHRADSSKGSMTNRSTCGGSQSPERSNIEDVSDNDDKLAPPEPDVPLDREKISLQDLSSRKRTSDVPHYEKWTEPGQRVKLYSLGGTEYCLADFANDANPGIPGKWYVSDLLKEVHWMKREAGSRDWNQVDSKDAPKQIVLQNEVVYNYNTGGNTQLGKAGKTAQCLWKR